MTSGMLNRARMGWALRFERPRGHPDLVALLMILAWCMTAGEGLVWGLGADTLWIVSAIWSSASNWLINGAT